MRRILAFLVAAIVLGAPCAGVEHRSWNKILYIGGTVPIKTNPYDYNTTLTVSLKPDQIVVVIAPGSAFASRQTIRIQPSRVVSLSAGPAAWRRVGEVSGARLPAKAPALFGLLQDRGFLGIVYEAEDGKRGAMLLDTYLSWSILEVLRTLTGKPVEVSP